MALFWLSRSVSQHPGHGPNHGNKRMVPIDCKKSNQANVEPRKCPKLMRKCPFWGRGMLGPQHSTILNHFRSLAPAPSISCLNNPNILIFFGSLDLLVHVCWFPIPLGFVRGTKSGLGDCKQWWENGLMYIQKYSE